MKASLYDRLGGFDGICAIVNDVVDLHLVNPLIKTRFANSDIAKLKKNATLFFCAGGGGPESYPGKDMLAAHRSMNISEQEFVTALDDTLAALDKNRVEAEERMEVLAILYSLKDQIVRV
jgi:hemoglobin